MLLLSGLVILTHKPRQLWKLDGTTLVNKKEEWQSNDKWEFIENDESLISIRNATTNEFIPLVLTPDIDSGIVSEKAKHVKLILYSKQGCTCYSVQRCQQRLSHIAYQR